MGESPALDSSRCLMIIPQVYLQYGVQVITRQFSRPEPASTQEGPYVSLILALLMLVTAHLFVTFSKSTLFHRYVGPSFINGSH